MKERGETCKGEAENDDFLHEDFLVLKISLVVCILCFLGKLEHADSISIWHNVNTKNLPHCHEKNTPQQLQFSDICPTHPNCDGRLEIGCSSLGSYRLGRELKSSHSLCRSYKEGRVRVIKDAGNRKGEARNIQRIYIFKYVISKASSTSEKKAFGFKAKKTGEKYIWKGCVTHMAGGEGGLSYTILVMM